jgi:drug/metabolite transporter (DMT)-like permease
MRGIIYMLFAGLMFALMGLSVKNLSHLPSIEIVFFRSVISLVFTLFILIKRGDNIWGNQRKLLFARGILGTGGLILLFKAIQLLPLGLAITLNYLSPFFTILGTRIFLKEKVRWVQWLLLLLSFIGVFIINARTDYFDFWSLLIGICSAAFAGAAYTTVRMLKNENPLVVVLYFPLIATPVSLILAFSSWQNPIGIDWLDLLAVGTCAQIAQVFMTKAYKMTQANLVATASYSTVIFSILLDITILGKIYDNAVWPGLILIAAGILINSLVFGRKSPKGSNAKN